MNLKLSKVVTGVTGLRTTSSKIMKETEVTSQSCKVEKDNCKEEKETQSANHVQNHSNIDRTFIIITN
jgi:hypothetical protein